MSCLSPPVPSAASPGLCHHSSLEAFSVFKICLDSRLWPRASLTIPQLLYLLLLGAHQVLVELASVSLVLEVCLIFPTAVEETSLLSEQAQRGSNVTLGR